MPASAPRDSWCWPRSCDRWAAGSLTGLAAHRSSRGCSAAWRSSRGSSPRRPMVPFTVGALVVRDLPGARQRRGVQARARAVPDADRHGDRPRWRARRPGRVLPAPAARGVPRPAGRRVAGLRAAVGHGARAALREPAGLPPVRSRLAHHPVAGSPPPRRADPGCRVGRAGHPLARGRHRRRVAAPAALRRGARRLYVRHALCRVRHHLSLRDVARPAADAHVLAPRLGDARGAAAPRHQRRAARAPRPAGVRGQHVHLQARRAARTGAPADHVGLHARGGDHVPARLGLDSLRDGARRPGVLPRLRVRPARPGLPHRVAARLPRRSTAWCGRRSW